MSTHVMGYRPPDDEWRKMKAAWDACEAAKAPIPKKVLDFFDGEDPGDQPGKEVNLGKAVRELDPRHPECGYEVDVTKLPEGVRFIRFTNSW